MKIAFATHAARSYPRARWGGFPSYREQELLFDWIADQGFDGIDLADSWVDFDRLDEPEARGLRDRASARNLEICALNCLRKVLCDPRLQGAHMSYLRQAIRLASWLGAGVVSISLSHPTEVHGAAAVTGTTYSPGGSQSASEGDYGETAGHLRLLAEEAGLVGVDLSVELHHCSIADQSTALLQLLDQAGRKSIGANPDLINGYWAYADPPETWQDALENLAARTTLWHVKNAQRVYIPESKRAIFLERSLADGDIDYRWAITRMREAGFDGWISIENCGRGDPFEVTASGLHYIRRVERDTILAQLATADSLPDGRL